jgi:hypothetical protein
LFLAGSALPELSPTPSNSKDTADREASDFGMKLRIVMMFASNKIQLYPAGYRRIPGSIRLIKPQDLAKLVVKSGLVRWVADRVKYSS